MTTDGPTSEPDSNPQPDQRFPAKYRLRTRTEFAHVYSTGCRVGDAVLLVIGVTNGLNWTRIGLSVSRKHGCAVIRNLRKRRMREAFRTSRHLLPTGLDLILIPRLRDDLTVCQFRDSLVQLTAQLLRQRRRQSESGTRTAESRRPPKGRK